MLAPVPAMRDDKGAHHASHANRLPRILIMMPLCLPFCAFLVFHPVFFLTFGNLFIYVHRASYPFSRVCLISSHSVIPGISSHEPLLLSLFFFFRNIPVIMRLAHLLTFF